MNDSATLATTDEVIEKKYERFNFCAELIHSVTGGNANNYTVIIPTPIKDVVGICLVGVEIMSPSSTAFTTGGIYVSINDYNLVGTGNNLIHPAIYRFYMPSSGVTITHLSNPTNLGMNVFTYVPDPILGKLDRFKIKFYNTSGALYTFPNDTTVCVSVTVYAKRNKYSRV